jgi:hypothetical protein
MHVECTMGAGVLPRLRGHMLLISHEREDEMPPPV